MTIKAVGHGDDVDFKCPRKHLESFKPGGSVVVCSTTQKHRSSCCIKIKALSTGRWWATWRWEARSTVPRPSTEAGVGALTGSQQC